MKGVCAAAVLCLAMNNAVRCRTRRMATGPLPVSKTWTASLELPVCMLGVVLPRDFRRCVLWALTCPLCRDMQRQSELQQAFGMNRHLEQLCNATWVARGLLPCSMQGVVWCGDVGWKNVPCMSHTRCALLAGLGALSCGETHCRMCCSPRWRTV